MKFRGWAAAVLGLFSVSVFVLTFQNCGGASNISSASRTANSSKYSASNQPGGYVPNEIIVRMSSQGTESSLKTWAVGYGLVLQDAWEQNNTTHWSWSAPITVAQLQATMSQLPFASDILYTEPNYYVYSIDPQSSGGDVALSYDQVASLPSSEQVQTTVNIGQTQVWNALPSGQAKPIIAIIDTGIDLTHQAFTETGAIWINPGEIPANQIDDDGNGYVDDVNGWNWVDGNNDVQDTIGHGTHCAGIALGVGENILAASPTAAKIQIMPLKFIGPNGGLTSDAISAVYYAAAYGAKVMSNSWGGPSASQALEDAIYSAYQQNILFVAAAGNNSSDNDGTPLYPASYTVPNVMAIAATDQNNDLASFSDFGPNTVLFGSPGVTILSTYPTNQFAYLSGTSMATPFVAGTAIYMAYNRPTMGGYQIKNTITGSLTPNPALNGYTEIPGELNSYAAYQMASSATINNTLPAYTEVQFNNVLGGGSNSSSGGGGGGCGLVMDVNSISGKGPSGPLGPGGGAIWLSLFFLFLTMPLWTQIWLRRYAHAQR